MTEREFQKEVQRRQRAQQLKSLDADRNRAQTISVGNAGCGTTEISLRGIDGTYLFHVLHPAEVVELIHQLAASNGLHIMVKPRDDFASWREWRQPTDEQLDHLNGWAPFPELLPDGANIGRGILPPDRKFLTKEDIYDGMETPK